MRSLSNHGVLDSLGRHTASITHTVGHGEPRVESLQQKACSCVMVVQLGGWHVSQSHTHPFSLLFTLYQQGSLWFWLAVIITSVFLFMTPQTTFSLLLLLLYGVVWAECANSDIDKVIADLQATIAASQVLVYVVQSCSIDTRAISFMQIKESGKDGLWEQQKGVYPCNIRNNFVGGLDSEVLRDRVAIFDNNAFVTAWVSIILLEAAGVSKGPTPTDQQLYLALEALATYHDNNSPSGDGTMVFWPQAYNSSVKQWYCRPVNVEKVGDSADALLNFIHRVLDDAHLEKLWQKAFSSMQHVL